MCLGYEPNVVRASDSKSKTVGKTKKAAGVKRLGWFAVDLEHGWEVVSHLSSTMIQALGVRFVVCSTGEQADELCHPHHSLSFFQSDDTGRDDFFVDTQGGSLASATPTLGAPCPTWLESYDTEGTRRREDKVIRALEGTLSNSLYLDTAGALFVSESLATVPTQVLKDLPLLWWPGDIEDWDAEEIDEAVIKQGRPRRTLKAASLRALVYRLASPLESDMVFMNDFLRGFRFVAHPLDVLRLLVVRYFHCVYGAFLTPERTKVRWSMNTNGTPSHSTTPNTTDSGVHRTSPSSDHQRAIIQIRILNVLKRWYDMYPDDFTKFPELCHLLLLFLIHIRHDTRRVNFVKTMVSKLRSRGHMHWQTLETLDTVDPDDLLFPLLVESETHSLHSNQPSVVNQSQLSYTDYGLAAALTSSKYSMDSVLDTQPLSPGTNLADVTGGSGTLANKHRSTYKRIFFGGKPRSKRNPSNASEKARAGSSIRPQYSPRQNVGGGSASLPRVLDLNPKELFHQLTLVEHTMFRAITMDEFCYHSRCGGKAERQLLAPCLTGLIQWFNRMAMWVAKQILTTVELEDRIRLVQTFIHIAHQCLIWHNYNTCFEIVSGLTFSSVKRLYKTWEGVSSKAQQMLRQLNSIMSQRPNYKAYRACLRSVWNINGVGAGWEEALGQHLASRGKADEMMEFQVENTGVLQMGNRIPLLPFIGVHLTDFLYSDEGNPSYIEPHNLHDALPKTVGNWSTLSTANSTTTSLAELGHGSIAGTPRPHEMNGGYYSRRTSRQSEQLGRFQSVDPNRLSSTMAKRRSAYSTAFPFARVGNPNMDLSVLTGESQLLGTTTPNTPTQCTPMSPRTPMSPSASYFFGQSSRDTSPPYSATLLRKRESETQPSAATVFNFNQVPLVNCFKLRLMSAMLQKIQMAQQNLFPFRENVGLQDWLRTEVNHIYQRQILPTSPFAYQALQESLPLPKHTKVVGRQSSFIQSARQSSHGSPRVPSADDHDITHVPTRSPKPKASSPSLSLSWRKPSTSAGNGPSTTFRTSVVGCESMSMSMSPSLAVSGSTIDGVQRRRDTVGDSPSITHPNGLTSPRASRYPRLSPVPELRAHTFSQSQRASLPSPPLRSPWSSAMNTPMLSPNLPSQQELYQNPYRKSETTPKLNNLDPNFFQISEDLEEWDIWLHKLSRQLEPKSSGSMAPTCSPHESG
ncbi:hypothetical protein IWQ61_008294 [Dispira simplex]|nr:hypothetical protein IWQ61_008294 [Dispira simplex]